MKVYLKLMSVLLILIIGVMSVGVFGVSAESEYTQLEKFIYGDVDMDGVVTVKDATLIQKYVAQLENLSLIQKQAAKINGNIISVRNATEIQKYVAQIKVNDSKVGVTNHIMEPIIYEKNMIDASASGDELLFEQTECIDFDSCSETYKYFRNNMLYMFFETNYILEGLENTVLDNKYTDEYFENNALIVMSHFGSSSVRYRIDSIVKSGSVFGVNYTLLLPKSGVVSADVVNSRVYIEVSKSDIKGITDVVSHMNIELY